MKIAKLLLLLVLFFSTNSYSQKIIINGQETGRKLEWADFTGKVDKSSSFFAYTAYNINFKYGNINRIGDSVILDNFQATLDLDPKKSWVKEDKVTEGLLVHEQGHFNLGILCMQEILLRIKGKSFNKSNFTVIVQNIINETITKYNNMGIKYDEETNHSENKEKQLLWNSFFLDNLPK